MGKIVKYCSSCDEGFAEKFGFCPGCGAQLQAFEMNPISAEEETRLEAAAAEEFTEAPVSADPEVVEPAETVEPEIVEPVAAAPVEVEAEEPETVEAAEVEESVAVAAAEPYYQTTPLYADEPRSSFSDTADDDGFHVTVIQEKNRGQRNMLLLGSTFLVLTLTVGATIVSLFQKDLGIGAIGGDERLLTSLIDEVPMDIEEEPERPKDDKDAGGGGGGGRDEQQETSKGQLASQTERPIINPSKTIIQRENPELAQPIAATQGDRQMPRTDERYGDPNSRFLGLSDGTGTGGGQGSGMGQGQGSGRGTGMGSGTGSGSGSGTGDGHGGGTGSGNQGAPPPSKPKGPTTALRIISKPKALYTDSARQNQVQGTVRLRVTFLASGQIGSISTVQGLGSGLTEQAIAAARKLRFEPAMVDGVARSVTKQVEYNFTLY